MRLSRTSPKHPRFGGRPWRQSSMVVVGTILISGFLAASCNSAGKAASSPPTTPGWAAGLGTGVSLISPGSNPTPGGSTPGGVVKAQLTAFLSGHLSAMCPYYQPAIQSKCSTALGTRSVSGITYKNFALGYIAIKGNQALVATLGTDCEPGVQPTCVTNGDPAAGFTSGQSFDTLYTTAIASEASPVHAYSLLTCVKVGSHWYVYLPPSTS